MLRTPARLSISASCMLLTKRMFSLTSGIAYWRRYTSAFELSPVGDDTDFLWHKAIQSRHAWYTQVSTQVVRLSILTSGCSQIISKRLLLLPRLIAEELTWRCYSLTYPDPLACTGLYCLQNKHLHWKGFGELTVYKVFSSAPWLWCVMIRWEPNLINVTNSLSWHACKPYEW